MKEDGGGRAKEDKGEWENEGVKMAVKEEGER